MYHSFEHEQRFREANARVRRGGPGALICGARTRTGSACAQPPIREGKGRCLRHAGPKAANEHREAQRRAFESGRISAEVWNRAEARRAANKLTRAWKTDPWLPGRTIDLGGHELALRDAVAVDVDTLPPAVADGLRWRYRRTQIDRQEGKAWLKVLREDLPRRIADAGPRPAAGAAPLQISTTAPRTWSADAGRVENAEEVGRRALPDSPRAPRVQRGKGYGQRGRPRTQPAGEAEYADLMAVYREHVDVLGPIMEVMRGEEKQLAVLRTLRDTLARPNDTGARQRWMALVMASQGR